MRGKALLIAACVAPLTGCHIARNAYRTISHEPVQFFDDCSVERNLKKDAKLAWAEVCRQYPRRHFHDDFFDGFIDGYTDYLDSGGTAQIPAMPPVKYRRSKYFNPEGHEKIRQYFLGFKYGMDVAIATGCRPFLTVPVLLPEQQPAGHPNISLLPAPPDTDIIPEKPQAKPLPAGPAAPPAVVPGVNPPAPGTIPVPKLDIPNTPIKPEAPKGSIPVPPGIGNPEKPAPASPVSIPLPPGSTESTPIQTMAGQNSPTPAHGPIYDLPAPRPVRLDGQR